MLEAHKFVYASYAYIIPVEYRFDPTKNAANLRKHGISLAEVDGVLSDPMALTVEDDASIGEPRWITIGVNYRGTLLVAVWTMQGQDIRIISVRRPDPRERHVYEEGI
jgi:uncharacterized DUF497 family protein